MDYASLLNPRQLEAVTSKSQYLRIVAGAGSGKTRVLTYRISYLLSEMKVNPNRILAIAFTNKVAQEMGERAARQAESILGYRPPLHIMTFHSFAARFLRSEHEAFSYPSHFTIYDEDDQKRLVKNVGVKHGYKKSDEMVKRALEFIRHEKGKGHYPDDVTMPAWANTEQKELLEMYRTYEEDKRAGYALDFDDLILMANKILEARSDIRESWRNRFSDILVDEFQDVNDTQFSLLRNLASPSTRVYVVGDPDQTIYTWRGANQRIIMEFHKTFEGAETVILNENYRSTTTILDAANKLIAHNKDRIKKDLFTNQEDGEKIVDKVAYTPQEEAEWVAREIRKLAKDSPREDGEPDYRRFAVLYRSSYLTRAFESEFKDVGIPYRIYGGLRFYERAEVKDLLAYFNLMVNPLDDIAFERIANVPRRKVGDTTMDRLRKEAKNEGMSMYEYLLNHERYESTTNVSTAPWKALVSMVSKIEETKAKLSAKDEAYSAILEQFAKDIGYLEYVVDMEDIDEDRLGNVNELFSDISNYLSKNPDSDFAEYLQNVSLLSAQDDISGGNYVSLMTVHVAKGLEFDNVFVIGLNEFTFPSRRSMDDPARPDGLEEERRLCYVAMTRARKRLFLTCNTGYSYQTDSSLVPSRFYREAGIILKTDTHFSKSNWDPGFNSRSTGRSSYKSPYRGNDFGDGPHIDPFAKAISQLSEKPPEKKLPPNNIRDWAVGNEVEHLKFGHGIVTKVINGNILTIDFDEHGSKTIVGNYGGLTRIGKGGQA